jgi:hypothetical protein
MRPPPPPEGPGASLTRRVALTHLSGLWSPSTKEQVLSADDEVSGTDDEVSGTDDEVSGTSPRCAPLSSLGVGPSSFERTLGRSDAAASGICQPPAPARLQASLPELPREWQLATRRPPGRTPRISDHGLGGTAQGSGTSPRRDALAEGVGSARLVGARAAPRPRGTRGSPMQGAGPSLMEVSGTPRRLGQQARASFSQTGGRP